MKQKVLAYIVRRGEGAWQLLVFEHANDPGAGVQVPAGTVEAGERLEAALWRELLEESGLHARDVALVAKLAEAPDPEWDNVRHVYLLKEVGGLPNDWVTLVAGDGEDQGLVFEYSWVDIAPGLQLAGGQHRWLAQISEPLLEDTARS
jgi:ADP-ribose pyrophosphatase YjhB (NUDIX family)